MRTRRSWRNQNRLWKELGGQPEPAAPVAPKRTEAEIDAMWWISKTSRNLMKRDAAKTCRLDEQQCTEEHCDHRRNGGECSNLLPSGHKP